MPKDKEKKDLLNKEGFDFGLETKSITDVQEDIPGFKPGNTPSALVSVEVKETKPYTEGYFKGLACHQIVFVFENRVKAIGEPKRRTFMSILTLDPSFKPNGFDNMTVNDYFTTHTLEKFQKRIKQLLSMFVDVTKEGIFEFKANNNEKLLAEGAKSGDYASYGAAFWVEYCRSTFEHIANFFNTGGEEGKNIFEGIKFWVKAYYGNKGRNTQILSFGDVFEKIQQKDGKVLEPKKLKRDVKYESEEPKEAIKTQVAGGIEEATDINIDDEIDVDL